MTLRAIITLVLFNVTVYAQPLILLDQDVEEGLGKYSYMLNDHSREYSLKDIMLLENIFRPITTEVPSYRPSLSAVWVRFKIKNVTGKNYLLEINNPSLDKLELYFVDGNKLINSTVAGDLYNFEKREMPTPNFVFDLKLYKDEERTIYIRYTGTDGLELPIRIVTPTKLFEHEYSRNLLNGLYYGILIVTILYNLFLFITIRDQAYILYIIYVFTFGLTQATIHGYAFQYFWPELPILNDLTSFIFPGLTGIFAISFVRCFLQVKTHKPILSVVGYNLQAGFLLVILISILNLFTSSYIALFKDYLLSFILIVSTPYILTVAILMYTQGYRPARFFLMAWGIFLFGVLIYILKSNALLPHNLLTNNLMQIGSAIEAILLSMALGDKYNILKKEKDTAQNQMIAALEENQRIKDELNKNLEEKILIRTKEQDELTRSNSSLIKINNDLDSFVYTASHDLKAPIQNIEGLVNGIKMYPCYTDPTIKKIIDMMDLSIKRFKGTITDLSEVTKINKHSEESIYKNNIGEIVEEIKFSIKPMVDSCHAKIEYDFSKCEQILFPQKNLRSILFNLISNAIKYKSTDRTPEIFISTEIKDDYLLLKVKDNGLGLSKENKLKVFGMFKRVHDHVEGSGIGLYIVKRVIENEGGKIEVESELGKGSTFIVYFKNSKVHNQS